MDEKLVRRELPIQSIFQRDQACTATVPIHLDVMGLSEGVRTDRSLISDATDTVKAWYDEDMEYYLGVLRKDGTKLHWLEGYENFRDEWQLGGEPDKNGFLSLSWGECGEVHSMRFNRSPVILCNRHDKSGKFYTFESFTKGGRLVEIVYRNLLSSEVVLMSPEKMRKYGRETNFWKIDADRGIAEVDGYAFTSDYHMNMAKALLLRDFGVFYLNKLLDKTNKTS